MDASPAAVMEFALPVTAPLKLGIFVAAWLVARMVRFEPCPKVVPELCFLL
jgi:hypothetical protein